MAVGNPLGPVVPVSLAVTAEDRLSPNGSEFPLDRVLGYEFRQPRLLREALTHPSHAGGGHRRPDRYERLEFLGDRVLGLVVAEMLMARYPADDEGALSKRLVALVRREALVDVARRIGLDAEIAMASAPPGDERRRARESAVADGCEALIGALYLDGGLAAAAPFVRRHWEPLLETMPAPPSDAKTALQEWAQARRRALPCYEVVGREGPAHSPVFTIEVRVEGEEPVVATGPSKRAAEQAAALALLDRLGAAP